jgi:DNA primase
MRLTDHLIARGMNPKLYRYFKCYKTSIITFLLYNLSGQIVGYQHYRPNILEKGIKNNPYEGRYFTKAPKNTIAVFGWEVLNPDDRTIYIVEGVFKAATLHRLGFNALAVLTANPKPLAALFRALRGRYRIVAIGDGDKAGGELVKIVGEGVCSLFDLDEMSDSDVRELVGWL